VEAVSVVSLTSSSGGYINGRNSANLELLIDKTSSIYVIFICETGYWTRAMKRFTLFDLFKKFIFRYQDPVEICSVSAETIINDAFSYRNQLRDVNTIWRRSWYIAANVWKIYYFKIEVVPFHKF
jgi:hypothetical protein